MATKKKAGKATRERKRPDVSFNFGANARPKKPRSSSSAYFKAKYAGGGS